MFRRQNEDKNPDSAGATLRTHCVVPVYESFRLAGASSTASVPPGGRIFARRIAAYLLVTWLLTGCERPTFLQTQGDTAASPQPEFSGTSAEMNPQALPSPAADAPTSERSTMSPESVMSDFLAKPSRDRTDIDLHRLLGQDQLVASIEEIDLRLATISRQGLLDLAGFPALRRVDLSGLTLHSEDWAPLSQLSGLEWLSLEAASVSDASMVFATTLVNLRYLNVSRTLLTDEALAHLTGLSQLEEIDISSTQMTGAGLRYLCADGAAAPLRAIHATGSKFGYYGFSSIRGTTSLQVLMAGNTDTSDANLADLKGMREIRKLGLSGNYVSDVGLQILAGMKSLEDLDVSGNVGVSDATLKRLRGLPKLSRVNLSRTSCTAAGVEALQSSRPDCEVVFASGN